LGPSKKSQIIVPSERQRPSRVKRSSSSAAADTSLRHGCYGGLEGGNELDCNTSHHSSSSPLTTAKKHHHRRSSSSVSWKCEGATTEDSGLDQFIAANNRGVVFDFVNSFSSNGSKASLLPKGEEEEEDKDKDDGDDDKVAKHNSSLAKPPSTPTPPSSFGLVSNLKPPPPLSTSWAAKPSPPASKLLLNSNLKPPPPSSRVFVRDKNEFLFIEENNRNALSDFVRSVSSSTSETAVSTCAASSRTIGDDGDDDEDFDVENQKKKKMMMIMQDDQNVDVSISKQEAARQMERARVAASVEERQREVAVKTLMFFALAIALFVLNQKIRSTAPDGSDTPYFTTVVEQMLSGIERIKNERQTGPD